MFYGVRIGGRCDELEAQGIVDVEEVLDEALRVSTDAAVLPV
jgi:hypothetical protein